MSIGHKGDTKLDMKSMLLTGYFGKIEGVRHKVDSVPYEQFPYCCSGKDNTVRKEADLAVKRKIAPKKVTVVKTRAAQAQAPAALIPVTFWTQSVIAEYSSKRSAHQIKTC